MDFVSKARKLLWLHCNIILGIDNQELEALYNSAMIDIDDITIFKVHGPMTSIKS